MTTEVTDGNFVDMISKGAILIDFWAPWCGPCRMLSPIIDEIEQEMKDKITVLTCNVDENRETPAKFNIMGVPTLMIFKDGKVKAQRSGMAPKKIIQDWIQQNI